MKVVAFLPAKGSSERIQNKNTQILDGKPLFLRQLEKLVKYDFIDEVYLDTESEEIIDLASVVNCKVLKRDPALASNKTDGHQLFYNEVKQVEADIYIQILCTSPFIKGDTIQHGIEILKNSVEYDSVVLVRKDKQYTWNPETIQTNYDLNNIPNSNTLPDTIIETMGLYIVKKEAAYGLKKRIGNKPYLLEAKAIEAIDVNYLDEFELANFIAAGIRENERKMFRNLSHLLSSPILSDIFDELGISNQIIPGYKLNLEGKKILGRAKTLKIKKREATDKTSIYDALLTYQTIVPNDIILVENEAPEFAYFGELNANLAIRAGAIGAIIGGNTRDLNEVRKLQFPVFSKGYNCQDIKHKGTVAHYNKMISIEGVNIYPHDLVFADGEGIIVIPQRYEKQVLALAREVLRKEKSIVNEVAEGLHVNELRKRHGDF
jgi:regulator of RNase E activity RraA/CMP-N-acetylneuraminic acid synthetase